MEINSKVTVICFCGKKVKLIEKWVKKTKGRKPIPETIYYFGKCKVKDCESTFGYALELDSVSRP